MSEAERRSSNRPGGLASLAMAACAVIASPCRAAPSAGDVCGAFLPGAERHFGIPAGMLSAIAAVESGASGRPHPWTLNVAGKPRVAQDFASAALLLRGSGGEPRSDIAVGCMQIHMRYHLANVGTPEWILDPRNNVSYAATFLRRLYDRYGTWRSAVAHYNASKPRAQRSYLCQVARAVRRTAPSTAAALGPLRGCSANASGRAAGTGPRNSRR